MLYLSTFPKVIFPGLRLNFTYHGEEGLHEGIRRLRKGLEGLMRERWGRWKMLLAPARPIV